MQKPKIHVCTVAYNAEQTISTAIESVLNQTYTNIVYCIRDNGSTDHTYFVCQEYAAKDDRIILLHNMENGVYETDEERAHIEIERGIRLGTSLGEHDFFCLLDADDEYIPDFFERGVIFAQEQNLDIVIGGSEVIDAQTNRNVGYHIHDKEWIISGQGFSDMLTGYHWHMRQVWAKLYRRNVLLGYREYANSLLEKELKERAPMSLPYGGDTINGIYSFGKADRIGVLSGCCHKYYIYLKSVSSTYDANRIASDRILDKATREFLINKCGIISPRNNDALLGIYMNAIRDTLAVLLNAKISVLEKVTGLREILQYDQTKQLAALENFGDWLDLGSELRRLRREFFRSVADWLLSLQEVPDEQLESFCDMGEFACAAAEHAEGWVFFNKLRIRLLIDQGRAEEGCAKLDELEEVLPGDADLEAFRAQLPQ